ncbi:hypothetical protein [Mammaliicoccus sciuri]|uniref:hypothetical protein n=1 Tax=Mammaliicoccus sciuri TaxID=1296 RepID=UPI002B258CDF|nr:hypothetical protein [Mammaliicoccus sciuri]WQK75211.1 hypothetical protein P3U33_05635 [Mammaliicoccus sciuri]
MKLKQVNEVLEKLSNEVTKLNKELNENITIFYEDNGSFNHVLFVIKEDETKAITSTFDLYYKPSFYVNLSEELGMDSDDIIERIQENDDTMTVEDIESYFNNNYKVKDWAFETCSRYYNDDIEHFNHIDYENTDLVVDEIIKDIRTYLEERE